MTAPAEKPARETKLRKTASQIRLMQGDLVEEGNRILRTGLFGNRERWLKVSGSGPSAQYELQGGD